MMKQLAVLGLLALGAMAQNYSNPVLYQDLADIDIMRNGDAFYYSASTMHFSPGAPILRSYDLVNWEYFSHSVPQLDMGPAAGYNLSGGTNAYNKGVYASFFNYNNKTKTWYWGGCTPGDYKTYIYTSPAVEGPWKKSSTLNFCYYDCGMVVDDDGTMYVVFLTNWNQKDVYVAQLTADGLGEAKRQKVWTTDSSLNYIEGFRFYKRNGQYYILGTHPTDGNIILKASSPFGPFTTWKWLMHNSGSNLIQGFGPPAQGGLVSLADGRWYHMSFINGFPGGRIPVLAPVDWSSDGWPTVHLEGGKWAKTYKYPLTPRAVKNIVGTDNFTSLGPQYEWNHNPDPSAYSITAGGLQLKTATVTDDFFMSRNTLSHRILGPESTVTIKIDYSTMADGDRAGLVLFDYSAGWIGVQRDGSTYKVAMVNGITMDSNGWKTSNKGSVIASATISGGSIWLRTNANVLPPKGAGTFQYSTDGTNFKDLGNSVTIENTKVFFMGWRYGIFNYATKAKGGSITARSFTIAGTMQNSAK